MVAVLAQHNIVPDDKETYTRDEIFQAITQTFGVNPAVDCIYHRLNHQHELSQIKLCFDSSLNLVDCDGIIGLAKLDSFDNTLNQTAIGNCPAEGITYPASVKVGNYEYHYPRELAELKIEHWTEAQATCVTWLCHALMTVYSLMWITL
ncbi:unnamed protein product [Meganyctiphanes norvegica]|uniref:Uncharacterized protein n=1 Tax=Meganyctiphanes norvegica TaxID=48144 RepID=A0AAV2RCW6_MEGNR